MKIPAERVEKWLHTLGKARRSAELLAGRLGRVTVLLHGSFARGDFNLWSDLDLIVVSEKFRGVRILERFDLISGSLEPGVEAIPMTPDEFREAVKRPVWRHALARGCYVVRDDYNLASELARSLGRRVGRIDELEDRLLALTASPG